MNKQSVVLLAAAVSLVTMGVSCSSLIAPDMGNSLEITYFILDKPSTNSTFCNGADMDSTGYKTALTKKITETVPATLSLEEKIKTTLSLAAQAQTFSDMYTRTASTTFVNGIVTMHSASGWAGSSIFYCAWKPFVEKNLVQFPEVIEVQWATETEI